MAYQPEVATYESGVYQLEINDPVQGGVGGLSNTPLLQLANRTAWLYQQLELVITGETIPPTVAPLASPVFTGSPKAPTAALGDSSTLIATTAFVQGTVNGVTTKNVAGGSNVTLSAVEAGTGVLVLTGALTANIAVILPPAARQVTVSNQTTGAFTVTVKTASGTGVLVTQGKSNELYCDGTNVLQSTTDFISPALTGTPTAPTAGAGTSTTQLATTAFVTNAKNGATTVNVAGNANVTLTAAQAGVGIILLTGALTGAITVFVPAGTGQYIIANNTTGSYTLKIGVSGASGATAIVPQSNSVVAYSDGSNIVLAGAASTSSFTRYSFTATAAQTTFNAIYTVGNVLVLVNGVAQAPGDVTATDSATVVLSGYNGGAGCIGGEDVEIIAFSSFTVANAMTPAGGTFSGPIMLAGGDTGVAAAQFDNSTRLATTSFVQRAIGNFSTFLAYNTGGSPSLIANYAGASVVLSGTTAGTLYLPPLSTCANGTAFLIKSEVAGVWNVACAGVDGSALVVNGSGAASISGLQLDSWVLVVASGTWWRTYGTAVGFGGSLSSSGYQKLPSGLIVQWGMVGCPANYVANQVVTFSFPVAFPSQALQLIGSNYGISNPVATTSQFNSTSQGQVQWGGASSNANGLALAYIAFGR